MIMLSHYKTNILKLIPIKWNVLEIHIIVVFCKIREKNVLFDKKKKISWKFMVNIKPFLTVYH